MNEPIRKLAAIMFTDIAGYTETMSQSEQKALKMLRKKRTIIKTLIENHNGTYVKEIGDGTLSYFNSGYNASSCAKKLQKVVSKENLKVRIGIHIGDIVFDNDDVYGDGVNIAARLESIAPIGGVLISRNVYDELINKDDFDGVSLGLQSLKGVGRLVEVYAIRDEYLVIPKIDEYENNKVQIHKDDEVPSIAIIPFENKGKEEDIFYAYGISVDLISDVSSSGLIRVASKKQIDELGKMSQEQMAKKLDVRYMVNGELWRMDNIFQLSIELYDTKDRKVVWSDRWQEKWDNLPTIKNNLSDGLLKALDTKSKLDSKVETTNSRAYELYLKAKHAYDRRKSAKDIKAVRKLISQVIEHDNNLISVKVLLGETFSQVGDYDKAMEIYMLAYKQAKKLGDKSGIGLILNRIGSVHTNLGNYEKALDFQNKSLKIQEKLGNKKMIGDSLEIIGIVNNYQGNYEKALKYYHKSFKIKKELNDKLGIASSLSSIGLAHSYKRNIGDAMEFYRKALMVYEKLDKRHEVGRIFANIGNMFTRQGNYDKALDYHLRSLKIQEELDDKVGMGANLVFIGHVYAYLGDYDKPLEFYSRALEMSEKIGNKRGVGFSLLSFGINYLDIGYYDKALYHLNKSLKIFEEIVDKTSIMHSINFIGVVYFYKMNFNKALKYLEKSLTIQKKIGFKDSELSTTVYLYLCYRNFDMEYEEKQIFSLIKHSENIEFEENFVLFKLLKKTFYLECAYNQVQDKVSSLGKVLGNKLMNYPIPKKILENYNGIKNFKKGN